MRSIAIAALAALTLAACGTGKAAAPATPAPDPTKAASAACRAEVVKQLKAPATARWSGETVVVGGPDPRVQGYVDAQNSFGALLRLTYSCRPNTSGSGINALVSQAD